MWFVYGVAAKGVIVEVFKSLTSDFAETDVVLFVFEKSKFKKSVTFLVERSRIVQSLDATSSDSSKGIGYDTADGAESALLAEHVQTPQNASPDLPMLSNDEADVCTRRGTNCQK